MGEERLQVVLLVGVMVGSQFGFSSWSYFRALGPNPNASSVFCPARIAAFAVYVCIHTHIMYVMNEKKLFVSIATMHGTVEPDVSFSLEGSAETE
jgi:hypothetical protein